MPLALIHAKRFTNSLSCEQMIGRGGLEVKIQVGIRSRVLIGVIGECLVKIHSIATMFTPRQGVHKILNFSDENWLPAVDTLRNLFLASPGKMKMIFEFLRQDTLAG